MAIFFIGGVNSSGRMMVGFCYMVEMAPKNHQSWMCTLWDIHDGTIMIWVTLVYIYLSKSWKWTMYWAASVQLISIILVSFFLPESPKWLYSQKRYEELYSVMVYMANKNGKKKI